MSNKNVLLSEKKETFDLFVKRLKNSDIKLDIILLGWIEDLRKRLDLIEKEKVKRLKEDVELMSFITEIGGRVIHFEDVLSIIKNKFGDFK